MSVRADAETFRQVAIFRDCDSVPLQILAFSADRQEFSIGEDVITQGKKARAAFFILNGRVVLRDAGKDIGMAEPGSLLGEVAMIGSGTYSISATARDVVSTARISHELFLRVAKEYPEFGRVANLTLFGCCSTRPGSFLIFSLNQNQTWQSPAHGLRVESSCAHCARLQCLYNAVPNSLSSRCDPIGGLCQQRSNLWRGSSTMYIISC
jgi:Cyclic nucleotide-binding domain